MERKRAAASLTVLVERQDLMKGMTKTSGVLSAPEFGRDAIKAVLSDRGRKSAPNYLRACRAPVLSLSSENLCFCTSLYVL